MRFTALAGIIFLYSSFAHAQGYSAGQSPCLAPVTAFLPGPTAAAFCNPAPADSLSGWTVGCSSAQPYLVKGHAVVALAFAFSWKQTGRFQCGLMQSGNEWYRRIHMSGGFSKRLGRGTTLGMNMEYRRTTIAEGYGTTSAFALHAAWRMPVGPLLQSAAGCRIPVSGMSNLRPQLWTGLRAQVSERFHIETGLMIDSVNKQPSFGFAYAPRTGFSVRGGIALLPLRPGLLVRMTTHHLVIQLSIESHAALGITPAAGFEWSGGRP
jgi:hypothetical protein